jgi:hypothetical protein
VAALLIADQIAVAILIAGQIAVLMLVVTEIALVILIVLAILIAPAIAMLRAPVIVIRGDSSFTFPTTRMNIMCEWFLILEYAIILL